MPRIEAICVSDHRGTQKVPVKKATLIAGHGIEGDAHAGTWHRQVSLLSSEKIDAFRAKGAPVETGSFGENLIISGIDVRNLPVGTRVIAGEAILEITQIGKECHNHCAIYQAVGDCIMPREGVFARVLRGGEIEPGMDVQVDRNRAFTAAIITLSDKASAGARTDKSGPAIKDCLLKDGQYDVVETLILPDDKDLLCQNLRMLADERHVDLVLTTGSTGFSPRDIAPEATLEAADRTAPGIAEAIRAYSMTITKRAMLSRGVSVLRGKTLIVNLPGSPKACAESLECILDTLPHGLKVLRGEVEDCARTS